MDPATGRVDGHRVPIQSAYHEGNCCVTCTEDPITHKTILEMYVCCCKGAEL